MSWVRGRVVMCTVVSVFVLHNRWNELPVGLLSSQLSTVNRLVRSTLLCIYYTSEEGHGCAFNMRCTNICTWRDGKCNAWISSS